MQCYVCLLLLRSSTCVCVLYREMLVFKSQNAPKRIWWPGPAGKPYSAPQESLAGLKDNEAEDERGSEWNRRTGNPDNVISRFLIASGFFALIVKVKCKVWPGSMSFSTP